MRLGVGAEGDSVHEKPRTRESTPRSWWGEIVWNPSLFQHPTCQDVALTSEAQPGTATVPLCSCQLPVPDVALVVVLRVCCSVYIVAHNAQAAGSSLVDAVSVCDLSDPRGAEAADDLTGIARCPIWIFSFRLPERCHRAVQEGQRVRKSACPCVTVH